MKFHSSSAALRGPFVELDNMCERFLAQVGVLGAAGAAAKEMSPSKFVATRACLRIHVQHQILNEPLSKLLVSLLISPIVVPYIIPYITPL